NGDRSSGTRKQDTRNNDRIAGIEAAGDGHIARLSFPRADRHQFRQTILHHHDLVGPVLRNDAIGGNKDRFFIHARIDEDLNEGAGMGRTIRKQRPDLQVTAGKIDLGFGGDDQPLAMRVVDGIQLDVYDATLMDDGRILFGHGKIHFYLLHLLDGSDDIGRRHISPGTYLAKTYHAVERRPDDRLVQLSLGIIDIGLRSVDIAYGEVVIGLIDTIDLQKFVLAFYRFLVHIELGL